MTYQAQTEERAKLRREKSKEAIGLALKGQWEAATAVNRSILELFPDDVEALNRLGKAFLELGRYSEARIAFERATKLAPYNAISKKNLERLAHLQEAAPLPKQGKVVTPYLFIEESGKSGMTPLHRPAPGPVLAKMAAGDSVKLEAREHVLVVENSSAEYLGQVEPKLGMRLIRLMKGGNRYDAAIISVNRQDVSVIIWEAYRHPSLDNVYSFPTRSRGENKVYLIDSLLRYDADSEADEDGGYAAGWRDQYPDGMDGTEEGEPSESQFARKPAQASQEDEEEE